jgi:ubiquinone/menaquinone biosynthesis C-methylase UbiE
MNVMSVMSDFDAIARSSGERWDHNKYYHKLILRHLPEKRDRALDIGCGTGDFAHILSDIFMDVTAIDFSHEMIVRAKERLTNRNNINLIEQDVLTYIYELESYDMIISIATFHHLPFRDEIIRLKSALTTGGTLIILDLYRPSTPMDFLFTSFAVPINFIFEWIYNSKKIRTKEENEAWKEHQKNDNYMSLSKIRSIAGKELPGVKICRLLFWRYILIWKKER